MFLLILYFQNTTYSIYYHAEASGSAISWNAQHIDYLVFLKQISYSTTVLSITLLPSLPSIFNLQRTLATTSSANVLSKVLYQSHFFLERKTGKEDERREKIIYLHQFSRELISEELFFLLIINSKGFFLLLQSLNFLE